MRVCVRVCVRVRVRVCVCGEYETGVHGVHLSTKGPPCLKNEGWTSVSQTVDGYSEAASIGGWSKSNCPALV